MSFMPFNILGMWFRGLLSIAVLGGGIYLLYRWYDDSHVVEQTPVAVASDGVGAEAAVPGAGRLPASDVVVVPGRRVFRFEPGWNRPTLELAAALALLSWAGLGRPIGGGIRMLTLRRGVPYSPRDREPQGRGNEARQPASPLGAVTATEPDEDPAEHRTGEVHRIRRPDGSELHVECYGPADAPPLVCVHGWGANSTEWFYPKRHLAGRFRLIVWDEPGLGLSKKPDNNDYRLEKLAADLDAVLAFAGGRPAVVIGHSIGGMIALTYCKEYPAALGPKIAGLVLVHTTYTNPVRTTKMAALLTAIEKPVLIPLMHLTIGLWPLVWAMNWMSYINGSARRSTHSSGFSGNETMGQLEFCTRFMPHGRPDVLARGMLGMIGYDATDTLPRINVPTLVVVGDQDATTKPDAGEFIARQVPGAELATLSPAKHMGLIEHHERFDRLVAEFADRCQPAGIPR